MGDGSSTEQKGEGRWWRWGGQIFAEAEINLQLKFFPVEEGGDGEEICNFKQLQTYPPCAPPGLTHWLAQS